MLFTAAGMTDADFYHKSLLIHGNDPFLRRARRRAFLSRWASNASAPKAVTSNQQPGPDIRLPNRQMWEPI
jgi:hypothetical protein